MLCPGSPLFRLKRSQISPALFWDGSETGDMSRWHVSTSSILRQDVPRLIHRSGEALPGVLPYSLLEEPSRFRTSRTAEGVIAIPPMAVQRSSGGKDFPTAKEASIVSSRGTWFE